MTGHNWPVDPLAGSPEDVINSTVDHVLFLPTPPRRPLHPLCSLCQQEVEVSTLAGWVLLAHPSFCIFQRKNNSTHTSTHLQAEVSGESKRKDSSFTHLEVKNSMAKPILSSCSTWRANQTSWLCKTEWKIWKNKKPNKLCLWYFHIFALALARKVNGLGG